MSSSTPAAQLRKIKKPMIERRRRERINYCLNQLKSIVLEATEKDETQYSKMEKADILEMTVAYLHSTRRRKQGLKAAAEVHSAPKTKTNVASVDNSDFTKIKTGDNLPSEKDLEHPPYNAGYRECADKVQNYLADVSQSLDPDGADVMAAVGRKLDRYLMTRSSTSPSSALNCADCFRHRIEQIIAGSPRKTKTKSSNVAGRTEHMNDSDDECVDVNNNDEKRNIDDVTELTSLSGSSSEPDVRLRDSPRNSSCSDFRAASSTPHSDDDRRTSEPFFDDVTGRPAVQPLRFDVPHQAFDFYYVNAYRRSHDSFSRSAFPAVLPMFTATGQPGTNSLATAIKGSQTFARNSPFSLQLSRLDDGFLACPVAASHKQVASMISASHVDMKWQPWL